MNKENVTKIFSRIPELETARLTLRKLRVSDSDDMFDYSRDPRVTEFLLWEPHKTVRESRDYLDYLQKCYRSGEFYDWGLVERASGRMIGTCGFTSLDFKHNSAEVGYVLNSAVWGKGYAVEALTRVLRFAFIDLNVHRVEAKYIVGNERSLRVMKKMRDEIRGNSPGIDVHQRKLPRHRLLLDTRRRVFVQTDEVMLQLFADQIIYNKEEK